MVRVKRGTTALKRRRKLLKQTKGYRFGRSTKERQAREAFLHAGTHAYRHRREKKREFRRLWNVQINAAVRSHGLSYSKFIYALKKQNIGINRKVLAELAELHPDALEKIIEKTKTIPL